MCPLVLALKSRPALQTWVLTTGQHGETVREVLSAFGVFPDVALPERAGASLSSLFGRLYLEVGEVIERISPSLVLVHGDTATAHAAALAAFHRRIPVGHVEAGLRTYDMARPFPEESSRRSIALCASYHFAPTEGARQNLLREGVSPSSVFVTGNTVVDALKWTVRAEFSHPVLDLGGRLILLTAHRREHWGEPLAQIFRAVRRVARAVGDVLVACPVHPNPAVRSLAEGVLEGEERIRLLPPLGVVEFHNLLARCHLVLTDSGGVQEEASALGRPTLVLRETTERPEGVAAGVLRTVGFREERVYEEALRLLTDGDAYRAMQNKENPYGDGHAAERIAEVVLAFSQRHDIFTPNLV